MDFLEFFNRCGEQTVVRGDVFKRVTSMDTPVTEDTTGLDSLDTTLTYMLIAEAYDIDEVEANHMPLSSIQDLKDFCDKHKKRDFDTVEEAMEVVK